MQNFFSTCLAILLEPSHEQKCAKTNELYNAFNTGIQFDFTPLSKIASVPAPGRPEKPEMVSPRLVPKRKLGTNLGHAGLIHALTHIEFNAINLALDACYRFQNMPHEYYQNWLEVARDEAYHFSLLNQHLVHLGYHYGYFTAHNGLWDMALKTEHDVLARMALVPRVLEARGIDAVPEIQAKIRKFQDDRGDKILAIIHHDEIKHVQFGDKWFKYICNQRGIPTEETYFALLLEFNAPKIRGAFNREDRKKAGFSENELNILLKLTEHKNA